MCSYYVSNCCGAPPLTETHENMGKCRKCKDGAIFEEEEEDTDES